MIGQVQDENNDGALIQVGPSGSPGSGSVVGLVLYNEGFMLLTGSGNLSSDTYDMGSATESPSWVNFAVGCNDGLAEADMTPDVSFEVEFKGTTVTPTVTMFAHAKKGELNFSSNPTFVEKSTRDPNPIYSSTSSFFQPSTHEIKNTVSSSFTGHSASFEKQTYISKVGIYDSNKNLIAIANLARPVRKKENDDYTFKLKLDI